MPGCKRRCRAWPKTWNPEPWSQEEKARELQAGLKKFTRKYQAIREIDFFPSGQGERTAMLLASLEERRQILSGATVKPTPAPIVKKEDYQGKTWVTRKRPYIDRLASFWLVRRCIDPDAKLTFISPREKMRQDPELVYFDMAGAEFTHREGLITFEVLAVTFGLEDRGLAHLAGLVRAVDLKEDLGVNEEAKTLKDLMDGLLTITPDDHELVGRALFLFDALYATYRGRTA